jgi:hypothetical protein
MWMGPGGPEDHEICDVDDAHAERGDFASEERGGGYYFEGYFYADAD